MTDDPDTSTLDLHVRRIYSDYVEMPGLRLTLPQAKRLWGLDTDACARALRALVDNGFLRTTDAGQYLRASDGREAVPLRMAKADIVAKRQPVRASTNR